MDVDADRLLMSTVDVDVDLTSVGSRFERYKLKAAQRNAVDAVDFLFVVVVVAVFINPRLSSYDDCIYTRLSTPRRRLEYDVCI